MDFVIGEDQQSLKELAAQILSDGATDETLRAFAAGSEPYDRALWQTLAEAGLLGLGIEEELGGTGFGIAEIGLLLEEQGRTLAPLPILSTLVLGALPLQRFGSDAQKQAWLPGVARGEVILTAALEELGNMDPAQPMLRAQADGNGWRLNGVKVAVPYGAEAARIIVPARTDNGVAVFLIDPAAPGVTITAQKSTSYEPQAELRLDDAAVSGAELIGSVEQGPAIARFIVQHGRTALTAYQVGLTGEALRRTAAYVSERIQFGRPIGSMQGVQQRAADGYIDVEAMRSAYMRAAWLLAEGEDNEAEVATAKYWAAIGGHRVTHTAQHLHGGMGADVDYPIHRFFLHAKQVELALGGAVPMLAAIGREIAAGNTRPLA